MCEKAKYKTYFSVYVENILYSILTFHSVHKKVKHIHKYFSTHEKVKYFIFNEKTKYKTSSLIFNVILK